MDGVSVVNTSFKKCFIFFEESLQLIDFQLDNFFVSVQMYNDLLINQHIIPVIFR